MFVIILLFAIPGVLTIQNFFATQTFFTSDTIDTFSSSSGILERIENNPNRNDSIRRFLKSYNSLRPVGVLIDDTEESNNAARDFIKNLFSITPNAKQITFFILKFNSSGTTALNDIRGTETDKLFNALTHKTRTGYFELGNIQANGAVGFYAILQAATVLPTESAILMFIDRKLSDEDLAGHTAIVKKKNIKVYVVWGGIYPTKTNEEKLLKELCSYSGGLFLINENKDLSKYNYRNFISNYKRDLYTSLIFSKSNITDEMKFSFPIDSEVNYIHIIITPSDIQGTLTTPKGEHVELTDSNGIASYGIGSFGFTERGQREVFLDTTNRVGLWNIHIKAPTTPNTCSLKIFVRTKLTAQAYFVKGNAGTSRNRTKVLKLDLTGHLGTIHNISLLNTNGNLLSNKLLYKVSKDSSNKSKNDRGNKEVDIELIDVPQTSFQVKVEGTDGRGNHFSRLTYVNDNNSNILPREILAIDVGEGSELIVTSGGKSVILFEVTNLGNVAADAIFYCKDDQSTLESMQPYRKIISPEETIIVTVTLASKYTTYQNLVTFRADVGSKYVEKKVQIDVGSKSNNDNTIPSLDYTYLSDCSKVIFSNCDQGTWTIEAKARDQESGLMQFTSQPKGIYVQNGFLTGTKEEVTGTYSDSCCNAALQLIAIDRANNKKTVSINAYKAVWGPGQISAVVLGILLFILLIILVIYLILRYIKKKKAYNLPTYRGSGM
ncbi:uncharacterized protein LOC130903794 [Diorhabda carinulata]|uniref:uncharacterized protein LOC130903794 n=1 Tax=Diorhabda carinulata TaxID=1163345 RepID=UPI0025A19A16|nr:uncharacterized protein LOC130903794 [Diorhabda carinulata]